VAEDAGCRARRCRHGGHLWQEHLEARAAEVARLLERIRRFDSFETPLGPLLPVGLAQLVLALLVVDGAKATAVSFNGAPLTRHTSEDAFAAASHGWHNARDNLILAKSAPMNVYDATKTFSFVLRPAVPSTSVSFACDRGFTVRE
jgi:hypothetical protein